MTRAWRIAFALVTCSAAACVPILGLDQDFRQRATEQNDSGSDADTGDAVEAPPCTSNKECIEAALESPSLCVAGKCVNVDTQLCLPQIRPNNEVLKEPDVIVVAAFMRGGLALQTGAGLAYDLALQEIHTAGGIQGRTHHELAMVVCDSDPAKLDKGLKHVIRDLRLPAILAAFGSKDLATLVPDAVDAGVFTMNPSFSTDALKFAATNDLVWNLLGTADDVALAYRPVLQALKKERLGGENANIKVALVATNGSLDEPMANVVERGPRIYTGDGGFDTSKALDMNGSPPSPANFKRFPLDSEEFPNPDLSKVQTAKQGLIDWEPDVIIALTAVELDRFVVEVDTALAAKNADAGSNKKTYWILGPSNGALTLSGSKKTALGVYLDYENQGGVAVADEKRSRFLGVQYAGAVDKTEHDLWVARMQTKYNEKAAEGLASENFYDSIYWLAYGFAAAGNGKPIEGHTFSVGVRELVRGPTQVLTGDRDTIQRAFAEINLYQGTTFVGALGPPDINAPTGTWNSVGGVYCYPPYQQQLQGRPAPDYDQRRYLTDGGLAGAKPLTCTE